MEKEMEEEGGKKKQKNPRGFSNYGARETRLKMFKWFVCQWVEKMDNYRDKVAQEKDKGVIMRINEGSKWKKG